MIYDRCGLLIFFSGNQKTEDLLYQAMSYMEKRQPKAAIPLFKKIIKQDPKNTTALHNQGLALNQLKKYQDAITCFDQVSEIDPNDVAKCDIKKLHDYHFHMIANDKIFFLPGKLGAFSDVHTKSDITNIAKSTDRFLTKFKK